MIHGTTILCVRRNGKVAVGGDGQVTMGDKVMKGNARKVRRLRGGSVIAATHQPLDWPDARTIDLGDYR